MKIKSILIATLIFSAFCTVGFTAPAELVVGLPYDVPDSQIRPLRSLIDESLEHEMKKQLHKNRHWAELIRRKKMCVGLVDLTNPFQIKYARVNGNVMLYAASLPKLAILLAAFESFQDGSLKATPEIENDMRIMISRSNNAASTRMIQRIGIEKIISTLKSDRYKLYDEDYGGGLWVGKEYASESRRHPDPLLGLSHAATVSQVCRYYYLLSMGKLVSRERSREILNYLVDPKIEHKFVAVLHKIVPTAKLFRKSGTWKTWHSDSVLVWGPNWRRYIAAALIEDPEGGEIITDLIPVLESVLKSSAQQEFDKTGIVEKAPSPSQKPLVQENN